jgi:NAD-dependent dihydropyrimidine dehydrogenase PreA subunit
MGWPARAYGNPNSTDILLIPLAIRAGIGELGKHASMISAGYGSNFRLAAVLTDLPLATDSPVDIGVEDLCAVCRRCVDDCPPRAVFEDKQIVRGERKWYVDFDRCIPYFVKTVGCAICIEVCPWSEPGRGPELSARLLRKRAPGASPPRGPDPGPAGVEGARPSGAAILRMRRGLDRLGAIRRSLARWSVTARGRRTLIGALVVLALAAAGGLGYMKLVEKGFLRYNKWDRRVRGTLRIGDQAPDLELTTYDGSRLRLSALWAKKPVVLVFGSCT